MPAVICTFRFPTLPPPPEAATKLHAESGGDRGSKQAGCFRGPWDEIRHWELKSREDQSSETPNLKQMP